MQNNPQTTPLDAAKQKRDAAFDAWQQADQQLFQCLVTALSVTGRNCTPDWLSSAAGLDKVPDWLVEHLESVELPENQYLSLAATHVMLVQALNVYVEALSASADYLAAEESVTDHLNGVSQAGEVSH